MKTKGKKTNKKASPPIKKKKAVAVRKKRAARPVINVMDLSKVEIAEHLHVKPINPEANHMHDALGITEERKNQLQDLAKEAYFTTNKFTGALEKASLECKHANELAFMTFLLADIRHTINNPLAGILGSIVGKSQG